LKYPPSIRIVKLPCSGRIDPLFLLRGFVMGADGILVSGCHPGDCHYTSGNYVARRRWILFRELLDFVGLDLARVHFSWVSAAEGGKFVEVVKTVTEAVRSAGPFPGFAPSGVPRLHRSMSRWNPPRRAEPCHGPRRRTGLRSPWTRRGRMPVAPAPLPNGGPGTVHHVGKNGLDVRVFGSSAG